MSDERPVVDAVPAGPTEEDYSRILADRSAWRARAEKAEAMLAALRAGDMVLVPKEPTHAMLIEAENIDWEDSDVRGNLHNMWNAMLATRPVVAPPADAQQSFGYVTDIGTFVSYVDSSDEIRNRAQAVYLRPPADARQEPCIGKDPACPCQDGLLCHYRDSPDGKTKGWPVPPVSDCQYAKDVDMAKDGWRCVGECQYSATTVPEIAKEPK